MELFTLADQRLNQALVCGGNTVAIEFKSGCPMHCRDKQTAKLVEALAKGDEVITQAGIAGRITKVADDFVTVAIAENVEVLVQRAAIGVVLPKGTLKN